MISTPDCYDVFINQLNSHINQFNQFLSKDCQLKPIKKSDPEKYVDIRGKTWDQWKYPDRADSPGVYVLCGPSEYKPHGQNPPRLAAYIGKASNKQVIGKRLYVNFQGTLDKDDQGNVIYRYGKRPFSFLIEVIITIPTQKWLAPALEEYMIYENFIGVDPVNTIGLK
jgi:hypothetical protein